MMNQHLHNQFSLIGKSGDVWFHFQATTCGCSGGKPDDRFVKSMRFLIFHLRRNFLLSCKENFFTQTVCESEEESQSVTAVTSLLEEVGVRVVWEVLNIFK